MNSDSGNPILDAIPAVFTIKLRMVKAVTKVKKFFKRIRRKIKQWF